MLKTKEERSRVAMVFNSFCVIALVAWAMVVAWMCAGCGAAPTMETGSSSSAVGGCVESGGTSEWPCWECPAGAVPPVLPPGIAWSTDDAGTWCELSACTTGEEFTGADGVERCAN